jgi:two-component system chemotaxis sensor kinase CheA
MSIDMVSSNTTEMEGAIDDLALQIMVKGAAAFRSKAAEPLAAAVARWSYPAVAAELEAAIKQAKAKKLSDEEARAIVARIQSSITLPAASEEVRRTVAEEPAPLAFEEDPELLADFVLEADEHLTSIEEKILLLEKDPSLIDTIHAIFRSFHSIKGLAGFLGLSGVQAVAHEVETLLDHARNLRVSITSDIVDLVLESSEYLKDEVVVVRSRLAGIAAPPARENKALLEVLVRANLDVSNGRSLAIGKLAPAADYPDRSNVASEAGTAEPGIIATATTPLFVLEPAIDPIKPEVNLSTPIKPTAAKPKTVSALPTPQPASSTTERRTNAETASTSVRVETTKLDRLMDMVGEMVIAQSILSNSCNTGSAAQTRLAGEVSQLARITSEVQRCALSMRMMPIGPLFQKNAKMVRDLARRYGKQVTLELQGEATELDKTIAEELSDPLMHMVRNALDHGIELPDQRIATGKSPMAVLRIAAEHQAGQIVISISDDGCGLDPKKIRDKAIQNGLIDQNAHLSEDEVFHLIFAPGFSTAEKITDISGRGVGMDVVRQHVEELRGHIEIKSTLGAGTTFLIYLPLTLAIIEGLIVIVAGQRYIIPLFSVREMFRPAEDALFTVQGQAEMILMRGSLLPLVRLYKRFAVTPRSESISEGLLVVCEYSGKRFCLFVDDLLGRQEVVIKSLDEAFRGVKGLVGSAILGDGRIGLILDVAGIFASPYPSHGMIAA